MPTFVVDTSSPTPIYAQLERSIRAAIATGELARGAQLPTVRQLAVDLAVNANTVARVYAQLERDGMLETRRGVGTFVPESPSPQATRAHRERELRSPRQLPGCDSGSDGSLQLSVDRGWAARIHDESRHCLVVLSH